MILNYRDQSDRVTIKMKTRYNNYMTDYTNAVYAKNKTKLPWPIRLGPIYDENGIRQRRDRLYRSGLCQIEIELLRPIWLGVVYSKN